MATNVKIDAEKVEILKMKGVNISALCREAIDSYLRLSGGNLEMLKDQLVEIETQMKMLNLEKKLVLDQIEMCETNEVIERNRTIVFFKWKGNLAFMYKKNTIDWHTQKQLFKFSNMEDCKRWIIGELKKEKLIE
jgi:hypothetical protein